MHKPQTTNLTTPTTTPKSYQFWGHVSKEIDSSIPVLSSVRDAIKVSSFRVYAHNAGNITRDHIDQFQRSQRSQIIHSWIYTQDNSQLNYYTHNQYNRSHLRLREKWGKSHQASQSYCTYAKSTSFNTCKKETINRQMKLFGRFPRLNAWTRMVYFTFNSLTAWSMNVGRSTWFASMFPRQNIPCRRFVNAHSAANCK